MMAMNILSKAELLSIWSLAAGQTRDRLLAVAEAAVAASSDAEASVVSGAVLTDAGVVLVDRGAEDAYIHRNGGKRIYSIERKTVAKEGQDGHVGEQQ